MTKSWNMLDVGCGNCGCDMEVKLGEWGSFYSCTNPQCYNRFTANVMETLLDLIYADLLEDKLVVGKQFVIKRGRLHLNAEVKEKTSNKVKLGIVNVAYLSKNKPIGNRL